MFVDIGNRAWGNGILEPGDLWAAVADDCGVNPNLNPNHVTISCETEDLGSGLTSVSEAQYAAVLYAAWQAKLRYPSTLRYLVRHADISPHSRPNCPGDRWTASGRFGELAQVLDLKTTV